MKVLFSPYFKSAGVLLCSALLLFSCSKDDGASNVIQPAESDELKLTVSADDIDVNEEVTFTVTVRGKEVDANIYIDGTKISGNQYRFQSSGEYKILAKKDGLIDSNYIDIKVYQNDIYAVGYKGNSNATAKYWKNDVEISIAEGTEASLSSIFVDNDTVYISGQQNNMAKYWRNGVGVTLGGSFSNGYDVFVFNGDVYVCGYRSYNGRLVAAYWKNGIEIPLPSLTVGSQSHARSIFVDKGNVYIVGIEFNSDGERAVLWKNGVVEKLSEENIKGDAYSVFVYNEDVYVAGSERSGSKSIAKYWKNGIAINLSNGSENAKAYSIYVDEGDVYVAGYEDNIGKYWKNGIETTLVDLHRFAQCLSVFVNNGSVYVSGYGTNGYNRTAKYWKNSNPINLCEDDEDTYATSIFVTRKLLK